tara:strand:+ start:609 stop:755 length:147 start_codon:yes stop_codon:yes gene_type:complete
VGADGWVKVRDGAVGVGPLEVQAEGSAVRGQAQAARRAFQNCSQGCCR